MTLGQILFELRATQVENCKRFTKKRAITLKILNKSTRIYPGARLHMLIIFLFSFMTLGQILFELRATQKRMDERSEGRMYQHLGFMCFVFDLYEAQRPLDVRPEGRTDGRTDGQG
jgi:hypothetical protein